MDSADVEAGENVDTNDSKTKDASSDLYALNYSSVNNNNESCNGNSVAAVTVPLSPSSSGEVATSSFITPPDGGWGWVVVFASFMISLIADGVSLSFGIIFVDLVDYFGESKGKTSWVGSIFFSMPLLAGPIASYLSDRYGCRKVCIAGALLSTLAFILSTFATSLEVLFVTFTIAGLGLALCYVTSVVIVAYYFEKRRSLATGISTCGTGVGTFIFPPLTIYLLEEYSWQGALLILSGFFLNIVVFGALMRDLEPNALERKSADANSSESKNTSQEDSERLCSSLVQLPTYLEDDTPLEVLSEISNKENGYLRSLLRQHPNLISSFFKKRTPSRENAPDGKSLGGSKKRSILRGEPSSSSCEERRPRIQRSTPGGKLDPGYLHNIRVQRGSITYRGAMLNIRRYRLRASSCPNIYRNSMTTIDEEKSCFCFKDLKEMLVDMFNFSIFKNVQYTLFCFSNFLLYACVDVPYVYIPDHASLQNINKESASYLISILGVLNTLGVVIVGYVGDKPWIDSSILYSGFITISGLMLVLIPWVSDYYGLAAICAIYGFTISANYTLIPIIIVNLISLDSFTGAYGLLLLVQGVASLVGPPPAGMLFDLTGNYNVTFICTGIIILISGLMVAILPAGKWFSFKRNHKSIFLSVAASNQGSLKGSAKEGAEDPDSILYRDHSKICKDYLPNGRYSTDESKGNHPSSRVPFLSVSNNNVGNGREATSLVVCKNKPDAKTNLYENPLSEV